MTPIISKMAFYCILLGSSSTALAQPLPLPEYETCLLHQIQVSSKTTTADSIHQACLDQQMKELEKKKAANPKAESPQEDTKPPRELGAMSERMLRERLREFDPFVIIPHRMNYVLPVYTTDRINSAAYRDSNDIADNMENLEAKFQLSLKVPLNPHNLLVEGDALYFAFTVEAWWQVYADNISKPFRETNYRPELFYLMPLEVRPWGGNAGLFFGGEHQSNGQSTTLSRSWNRVYAGLLFEKGNFALKFQPWWRLPEKEDEYPGDPEGDDNPDIGDYMGYFEMTTAYTWSDYELSLLSRQNFNTGKGALDVGFTFPIWGRLRGYAKVFSGYGDSLIDYNYSQTRIGLGLALTDLL